MADFEELRQMHDLLMRALHLLKCGCNPAGQIKIRELYRRRYPWMLEGLSDLSTIKSPIFSLDGSSSPVEPDLAVAGTHLLPSTSVTPHSPFFPVGLCGFKILNPHLRCGSHLPQPVLSSVMCRIFFSFFFFLPGGRRDYTVQIQLRLCLADTSFPEEDNYTNSLCMKVNGKLFPLPGYAPPPKDGIEQKHPGCPLNITSLVRLSSAVPNQISISEASEIGKKYSMSAPDSEIATTSLRVNLMCPLGKMRLTIPCHAVTCAHLWYFDAVLYLQMNEKKPTWICPVCDQKKAAYESLILNGIFMEILNDCSDMDEIKFQEDDSLCPMRLKKEAMKVSSQPCTKTETSSVLSKPCSVSVANETSKKKVDVVDLTIETIFCKCPSVTSVDPAATLPSLTGYLLPFHHTPISGMSSDLPGFLTSPLTASSTSVSTTSPHESSTHVSSSSSRSETGVIINSGSNIPDVISLD
ncbi:hypothetical protein FD755_019040 [Muntiacus reevesi]|uniref:SP-RING-type domain-containing protein n=1 Tax=Muntiacus reevesi TaxID=9886 RepID=A0A5N3X5R8_MUNRE|nr:hypothetical protein FD755_019040 [Muntiacus reevesi]